MDISIPLYGFERIRTDNSMHPPSSDGTGPLRLFLETSKVWRFFKLPSSTGMMSSSKLEKTSKDFNLPHFARFGGILPTRKFPDKSKTSRLGQFNPISSGIDPLRWLKLSLSSLKFGSGDAQTGTDPLKLLLDKSRVSNLLSLLISVGISPDKALELMKRNLSSVRAPIEASRVPLSPKEERPREVTRDWGPQETPDQRQRF